MFNKFNSILLLATLLFSQFTIAAEIDPDKVLNEEQKAELRMLTNQYANLMNAISAKMKSGVVLRSPEAEKIFSHLNNCDVNQSAGGDLVEMSGDACAISYEIVVRREDLGLNESGDPITEVETTEYFSTKTDEIAQLVGFVGFRTNNLDHSETLVSTPAYLTTSTKHMHFLTTKGEEIESSMSARFYTNMENADTTLFRTQLIQTPNLAAKYELVVKRDSEDKLTIKRLSLNKQETTMQELEDLFTPEMLAY